MTAYSLILLTQSYNGYHPVNTKVFTDMIIKTETINFLQIFHVLYSALTLSLLREIKKRFLPVIMIHHQAKK